MKTLYLDCGMGAAGDMLTAALLELTPDPDAWIARLNALGIPGVEYKKERSVKCGVTGTRVTVLVDGMQEAPGGVPEHTHNHGHGHEHDHEHEHAHPHAHSGPDRIRHIVTDHMHLSPKVAADVLNVYALLADAESSVHGVPVTEVHFHEVGAMDALADVAAVCTLLDALSPDEIVCSPVHVGCGQVQCAHGVLPVPAPATALLLRGVPIYGGGIRGELCTPTGAALLKYFVTRFGDMPVMSVGNIGYGMGKKDFSAANCVRAMLGEAGGGREEPLTELSCNVDDMTGEEIGFAAERLFEGGARDVFTVPVGMKKNRPGTLIVVLCAPEQRDKLTALLFQHTSTLGVREKAVGRTVLDRKIVTKETPFGAVSVKESAGCGVTKQKIEYEDLARIAREQGISLREAAALLRGDGK